MQVTIDDFLGPIIPISEMTIVPSARVIAASSPENLLMIAFVPEDRGKMLLDTSTPGIEYTTVLNLAQTYVGYQ
jgi:hypothetical protein